MSFPLNQVTIENQTFNFHLIIDAREAILRVEKRSPDGVKIVYGKDEYWQEKQKSVKRELDYDWTYASRHSGTVNYNSDFSETTLAIDYEQLKREEGRDVIFYDENVLYEDEMGDNGTSVFSVKTRLMNYGILALIRCFIRVDNVIYKSIETRYYIDFDAGRILKECRVKEDAFDDVFNRVGRQLYRDNNHVAERLTCKSIKTFELKL